MADDRREGRDAKATPVTHDPHDTMEGREQTMQRDVLLLATAGLSLLNGQGFSPYFDPLYFLLRPFIAGTVLATPLVSFYLTSMFVSALSLVIAGVPAALYERFVRRGSDSTPVSISIWLGAMLLITLPTLLGLVGL